MALPRRRSSSGCAAGKPSAPGRAGIFKLTFFGYITRRNGAVRALVVVLTIGERDHGVMPNAMPSICGRGRSGIALALLLPAQAQFWDWGNRPQRQQQYNNNWGGWGGGWRQ